MSIDNALKKEKQEKSKGEEKFNTFSGVFVPSTLAIFGAVMYLILPKTVAGVGLLGIIVIILLAHSVSISTAVSLSAIATNIHVKGGGLYYLISRSLGAAFGGGLGIQLFLAQTVAISFYSIAFARGANAVLSQINVHVSEIGLAFISCLIMGLIAFRGAQFVIKIQHYIFAAILLSLVSVFLSPGVAEAPAELIATSIPFWVAFALFFPAVTGIDAGVGMSGDLKDPKKSLVRGTFFAIGLTLITYIVLAVKLSLAAPSQDLLTQPLIMESLSIIPGVVIIGILLATSSSALSYFMAAPRTLRAMAQDSLFSPRMKLFAGTLGNSKEPRIALLVSLTIALIVILSADLDLVSQIVTIFFLNVYGWINGAAFFEKISGNPSFRPSFTAPPIVSFYGMFISYAIMYFFSPWIMGISIVFQAGVFYVLSKTKRSIKLESVWDGVLFQLLKKVLNKIEETEKSKKNWRPTVVSFVANDKNRNVMFSLLDWIGANRGIMKFYYLLGGEVEKSTRKREKIEKEMKEYIKENNLDLFPRVIETEDIRDAVESALQSETIGNLPLNTALLDFDKRFELDKLAKLTARLKKNVLILKNNTGFSDFKYIDIWWEEPKNGNLMILIAYLISQSKIWKENETIIRVFHVVRNRNDYESEKIKLEKLIDNSRIDNITLEVIVDTKKKMPRIIKEHSHYADLVLLGFPHIRKKGITQNIAKEIERYTDGLSSSLIVLANDDIDFRVN